MNWKFWKRENVKNLSLTSSDGWSSMMTSTQSGASVTESTALAQSAVYRCISILSETIASLPLRVYRQSGDTREAIDHPLNRLLGATPNGEQTSFELREFQMTCLGLRGNAYSQKLYSNGGVIGEINPLNAAYMKVDRNKAGKLVFDYQETGSTRQFSVDEIWRIAALGNNGVTGLSPISLARESIGTAIAIEGHGASLFKNGVTPSVWLESDGTLDYVAFERLKEQIDKNLAGFNNAGKPAFLEGGLKAKTLGMTNADAQFIESRKFQIEDICRWYGVPPHMLALLDRATFSNIEQQSIDFVQNTIRKWLVRLESTMKRDLLTRNEQNNLFLSHSVEGLLRGDIKARYEAYGKGIDKGFISRNEVRKLENLAPVDGLEEFVLPVNIETISEREQRFSENVSNMLATQEVNAIRQEKNKGGDDFGDRMVNFYERFTAKLIDMGASKEDAEAYSLERLEQIENNQIDKIEISAQTKIMRIL